MSLVKCWYHYFLDRQACNNYAAYFFEHTLAQSSPPLGFRLVVTPPGPHLPLSAAITGAESLLF